MAGPCRAAAKKLNQERLFTSIPPHVSNRGPGDGLEEAAEQISPFILRNVRARFFRVP